MWNENWPFVFRPEGEMVAAEGTTNATREDPKEAYQLPWIQKGWIPKFQGPRSLGGEPLGMKESRKLLEGVNEVTIKSPLGLKASKLLENPKNVLCAWRPLGDRVQTCVCPVPGLVNAVHPALTAGLVIPGPRMVSLVPSNRTKSDGELVVKYPMFTPSVTG